jgi:PhzF family phenazine biosynthesis protein
MRAIAEENQLSETAFLVGRDSRYQLRWFTPAEEVDLCGHATLASGWVVLNHLEPSSRSVRFDSRSGPLEVRREGEGLLMSLPSRPLEQRPVEGRCLDIFGAMPKAAWKGAYEMLLFENEQQLRRLKPRFRAMKELPQIGWICTAPGDRHDFVQRFFAPRLAVDEDPVTGSAFASSVPYWARALGRKELHAAQISSRSGEVNCRLKGDRVELLGHCAPFMRGIITLPDRGPKHA